MNPLGGVGSEKREGGCSEHIARRESSIGLNLECGGGSPKSSEQE